MLSHECFILGPQRRFLFAFIPKVACTNWKCVLRYLHGQPDYMDAQLAHADENNGLPYLRDAEDIWEVLRDPDCRKFTCVRNPYSRVLSAYLNKIEPFTFGNDDIILNQYFHTIFNSIDEFRKSYFPEKQKVDFESFVAWMEMSNIYNSYVTNLHWLPQTLIIGAGQVEYDIVAKFENIVDDAKLLLEAMECDISLPSQLEVMFPPTYATEKMATYYTPAIIERVIRIYRADFECFGYDPSLHPLVPQAV